MRFLAVPVLVALVPAAGVAADVADRDAAAVVLVNGRVLTMDAQSSVAEALAIRGGEILATGDIVAIRALAGPGTRTIDLGGRTVVPGLIDTHAHFKAADMADYVVDMSKAKSVAEALEAIRRFAAGRKPGEWNVGSAWHPPSQLAEKRYLTRGDIDGAAPRSS